MTAKSKIRRFIIDELNWDQDPSQLTDDYPLIERHVVDSLGIFNIVSFIEEEFGVEIEDEELIPGNFGTIKGIATLIESKAR
jgi:acyl carrier protein